jgi:alpha-glucoside transport system permease protein
MAGKALTALITVVIGIGAALLLFYVLNKIAELLPARWEERIKPLLYILPAFLAIVVYLVDTSARSKPSLPASPSSC